MRYLAKFIGVLILLPFMLILEACLLPIVIAMAIVGFPFYLGIALVTLNFEDFIGIYENIFAVAMVPISLLSDWWYEGD